VVSIGVPPDDTRFRNRDLTIYRYRIDMTWPEGTSLAEEPAARQMETPHFRLLTTRTVRGNVESRTVQFEATVSEVPAAEMVRLAEDLGRLTQQIGGVMLAANDAAPPAQPPTRRAEDSNADTQRR